GQLIAVRVPTTRLHLDERDARLDQPPGHEAALAERGSAITLARPVRLALQVKRLGTRAEDHLRCLLVKRLMLLDQCRGAAVLRRSFHLFEEVQPPPEPIARHRQGKVVRRSIRIGDDERSIADTQEAWADARAANADEVRQVEGVFPELAGDDRSEPRMD